MRSEVDHHRYDERTGELRVRMTVLNDLSKELVAKHWRRE